MDWRTHNNEMFAAALARRLRGPQVEPDELAGLFAAAGNQPDPHAALAEAATQAAMLERRQAMAEAARQREMETEYRLREQQAQAEDSRRMQAADIGFQRQRGATKEDWQLQREAAREDYQRALQERKDQSRTGFLQRAAELEREDTGKWPTFTPDMPAGWDAAAQEGGTGLDTATRAAFFGSAIKRAEEDVAAGKITPEEADERVRRVRAAPTAYFKSLAPKKSAEEELVDVVNANLVPWTKSGIVGDRWMDFSADDLEENLAGSLSPQRDAVIHKLLMKGRSPEEIGWIARKALENQKVVDPSKLDAGWFQQDVDSKTGYRPAWHNYGELWRRRALQVASQMARETVNAQSGK